MPSGITSPKGRLPAMLDMIQTTNENDLQFNVILPGYQYLSKLKDNYHTQGTQWVENNSGVMVSLHSTVIQMSKSHFHVTLD